MSDRVSETPQAQFATDSSITVQSSLESGDVNFGCFKADPDDLFAFTVPKVVKIRAWPVGVLSYCLTLVVLVVVIFNVFNEGTLSALAS
jgi:hypothetical protein